MRVLPENNAEVRINVELTGKDIQLILRALTYVQAPKTRALRNAETELMTAFENLMLDYGLDELDGPEDEETDEENDDEPVMIVGKKDPFIL